MVERTIQHHARELAGRFYDVVRSAENSGEKVQIKRGERLYQQVDPKAFAKTYPTAQDYIAGRKHGRLERGYDYVKHVDDGTITQDTPGWMHWYDMARQQLVQMLSMSAVHQNLKDAIMDALIEDREKQLKQKTPSPHITQRHSLLPNG